MNPDQLRAAFEKNKPVVLGGGLAAVVGLALYRKRHAAAAGPDVGAALSAGSQTAAASGGAAYDSSASDLYGAIQPQLESIGQQLTQLQNGPKVIPAPPAPPHGTGLLQSPAVVTDKNLRWKPGQPKATPHTTIPRPGGTPAAPAHAAPSPLTYTVRPGDSLSKIAARYPSAKITAGSIYAANRNIIGSNPNVIRPNQKLTIR